MMIETDRSMCKSNSDRIKGRQIDNDHKYVQYDYSNLVKFKEETMKDNECECSKVLINRFSILTGQHSE